MKIKTEKKENIMEKREKQGKSIFVHLNTNNFAQNKQTHFYL